MCDHRWARDGRGGRQMGAKSRSLAVIRGQQRSRSATTKIASDMAEYHVRGWRRRRESNPGTGLCRPLPKPLGHVARRSLTGQRGATLPGGRQAEHGLIPRPAPRVRHHQHALAVHLDVQPAPRSPDRKRHHDGLDRRHGPVRSDDLQTETTEPPREPPRAARRAPSTRRCQPTLTIPPLRVPPGPLPRPTHAADATTGPAACSPQRTPPPTGGSSTSKTAEAATTRTATGTCHHSCTPSPGPTAATLCRASTSRARA